VDCPDCGTTFHPDRGHGMIACVMALQARLAAALADVTRLTNAFMAEKELSRMFKARAERLAAEVARQESVTLDYQTRLKRLEVANDRLTVEYAERGKVNADLNKRLQRAERRLAALSPEAPLDRSS
jgi:septal ring factor EnvC (AmiA/AmiB activator)